MVPFAYMLLWRTGLAKLFGNILFTSNLSIWLDKFPRRVLFRAKEEFTHDVYIIDDMLYLPRSGPPQKTVSTLTSSNNGKDPEIISTASTENDTKSPDLR